MIRLSVRAAALLLAFVAPPAYAQEAFVAQVGSVSVDIPQVVVPQLGEIVSSLQLTVPGGPQMPDLNAVLRDFPVPTVTGGGSSLINQEGSNNTAAIVQTGINAGLISQTGNGNMGMITQTGAGNSAAIYQQTNGASAAIFQSGSNNVALSVQQ